MSTRSSRPREVVFVVFDGVKLLDVVGPAEVFAEANRFGAQYRLSYVSPSGEPVRTSVGTTFPVDAATATVGAVDTVVVAGGDVLVGAPVPADLTDAVRRLQGSCRRLVSICTGSFALAAAGVLDGRRATTHWRHADLLARAHPAITVETDTLFVEDAGVHTSAGVSACPTRATDCAVSAPPAASSSSTVGSPASNASNWPAPSTTASCRPSTQAPPPPRSPKPCR